ncbi:MAG TPA: hypothetical protein PLD95_01055 [bacterium]|jgi:hypothetical protein|nr:hypothetical protein [bacterium]
MFLPNSSQDAPDTKCPVCNIVWRFGGTKSQGEFLEICPACKEKQDKKIPQGSLPLEGTKNN